MFGCVPKSWVEGQLACRYAYPHIVRRNTSTSPYSRPIPYLPRLYVPFLPRPKFKATAHFYFMPASIHPYHHPIQANLQFLLYPFARRWHSFPRHILLPQGFPLLPRCSTRHSRTFPPTDESHPAQSIARPVVSRLPPLRGRNTSPAPSIQPALPRAHSIHFLPLWLPPRGKNPCSQRSQVKHARFTRITPWEVITFRSRYPRNTHRPPHEQGSFTSTDASCAATLASNNAVPICTFHS